jgi:O-antigen ligase
MGNIYNYSKTAWQQLTQPKNNNPIAVCVAIVLISVPLSLAVGNISIMVLGLFSLLQFRKHLFFRTEWQLLLPVALFALMLLSLIWSIDFHKSALAVWKEFVLFSIPVCFLMFPVLSKGQKGRILLWYSYAMMILSIYYLCRAVFRFIKFHEISVFFYHELVNLELNAIHFSVYIAIAFFALVVKKDKNLLQWTGMFLLLLMIVLLSSKNIIVVVFLLLLVYLIFYSGQTKMRKMFLVITVPALFLAIVLFSNVKERWKIEYATAMQDNTLNEDFLRQGDSVYNVSIQQAWRQERFEFNNFFPGTAFRIYQIRIFKEMLLEDNILYTGYGLNASHQKVKSKAIEHNIYQGAEDGKGYQDKNFHNQYVQNFAELGIFGLLILVLLLIVTLWNGIRHKDFVHISFAILMISLFLTESFLWRQRGVMFFTILYCLFNSGIAYLSPRKGKIL